MVMQTITAAAINDMERFYRANFINSLTGFKSASLIGSANKTGQTNLAIFSSIVHIGSNPALVGFINRPRQAAPHTLANIEATGVYTINHVHPDFVRKAHQTSAKYAEDVTEFDAVNLTAEFREGISAPFVKESQVKYALSLQEIIPISINETFLVIGKVMTVYLADELLEQDGFLALEKAGSLAVNGNGNYYATSPVRQFPYAKP